MRLKFSKLMGQTQPYGLNRRLVISLSIPLMVIFCISCIWDYEVAKQTANAAHDVALADVVYDLEELIRKQPSLTNLNLAAESEAMILSNAPDKLYFSVRDTKGNTLLGDTTLPAQSQVDHHTVIFQDGNHLNQPVRIARHQIQLHDSDLLIQVVETIQKREQSSHTFLTAMVAPNLLAMLTVLLAVLWGVRKGLAPLHTLEKEIAKRSVNDLRELELTQNPYELRPLLKRLNDLFHLLRESNAIQQRFIADAAHQLRTPLAGLQTQIDLAVAEGIFDLHPARKDSIEEATTRIEHLLNQLLSYARTESAMSRTDSFEEVKLASVIERSASMFIDRALAKQIDLGFEIAEVNVAGLSWMLQEALGNLIDNALRYTPTGGIVTVKCGIFGGAGFLEVEDSGHGIPDAELPTIFDRFHHIAGIDGSGCGLGLSIVKQISAVHNAVVEFQRRSPQGFSVRIVFAQRPMSLTKTDEIRASNIIC